MLAMSNKRAKGRKKHIKRTKKEKNKDIKRGGEGKKQKVIRHSCEI
jgi:hypothetical protein